MLVKMSDADIESDSRNDDNDDTNHPLMANKERPQRRPRRKNRFKRKRKIAQCLLTTVVALIVLIVTATLVLTFKSTNDLSNQKQKSILLWSSNYNWGFHSRSIMSRELNCSVRNCLIERRSPLLIREYDAVVLTPDDNLSNQNLFQHSWAHRLFVYANKASLMMTPETFDFSNNRFNLTLTYRTDSDIVWNDFEVRTKNGLRIAPAPNAKWSNFYNYYQHDLLSMKKIIEKREKFAAIRICNNNTSDALVFDELRNYILPPSIIDVDYNCEVSNSYELPTMGNYKFFFAFEDHLCTDNISKLFYAALRNHVIPVVIGGPIVYSNFAPPHSYIVAKSFSSTRELAEYLLHLDENPKEYMEYLWWTQYYTIEMSQSPLCQLCEMLQDNYLINYKWGPKMSVNPNWWSNIQCYKSTPLIDP